MDEKSHIELHKQPRSTAVHRNAADRKRFRTKVMCVCIKSLINTGWSAQRDVSLGKHIAGRWIVTVLERELDDQRKQNDFLVQENTSQNQRCAQV